MQRVNEETRRKIERNGLRYWQIASELGVTAGTLTAWMREPLTTEKKKRVENAIKTLKAKEAR